MKSTKDKDPSSYIDVQDEMSNFLSDREKKLIEKGLYPENEDDSYFDDIPEGEEGGDLVLNKKNKSQFLTKYFKSMN